MKRTIVSSYMRIEARRSFLKVPTSDSEGSLTTTLSTVSGVAEVLVVLCDWGALKDRSFTSVQKVYQW